MTDFRPIRLPRPSPAAAAACVLACALLACGGDDYRLGYSDREVLPYEGTERLVFASAYGLLDTIYLAGYEERTVTPPIAGTGQPPQFEEYRLRAERFDTSLGHRVLQDDAVKVYRHTAGQTLLRFALFTRGAALFRILSTEAFAALPDTVFTAGAKTYRDVKVVSKDTLLEGNDAFSADEFYWSRDAGFVGYERDGVQWRLIEVE